MKQNLVIALILVVVGTATFTITREVTERHHQRRSSARAEVFRAGSLSLPPEERIARLEEVVDRLPELRDLARGRLLAAYAEVGRCVEARALIAERADGHPLDPRAAVETAGAAIRCEDWQAALDHAEAAIAGESQMAERYGFIHSGVEARAQRGWALFNLGRVEEGLAALEQAAAETEISYAGVPQSPAYLYWSQALLASGERDRAVELLAADATLGDRAEARHVLRRIYRAGNGDGGETGADASEADDGFETYLWQLRKDVARPIDDATFVDYEDQEIPLSSYRGKVVLLSFWYPQCPPCRLELPELDRLWRRHRDRGLEVVALDVSRDRENARLFIDEHDLGFSFLENPPDRDLIRDVLGVQAFPTTYFLDPEGRILFTHRGFDPERDLPVLEREIERMLESAPG